MGCKNTTPAASGTVLENYVAAGLPHPSYSEYDNDFERQIFMAINLCRHNPKSFVPHVRAVYKDHVLLRNGAGKKMNVLIAKLNAQAQLRVVKFDGQVTEAVRQNNQAVVNANEDRPTKGGNIAKYSELSGTDKVKSCYEFTMPQYEGDSGYEFVSLQLALDFENFDGASKAPVKTAASAAPAGNAMDAGGPAPDKGEQAEPVAAEEKKQAAQDTTQTIAKGDYSPILDETVELVGISNKAHKKCRNVIQVLYAKIEGNSVM
jgi:hypothetical protein